MTKETLIQRVAVKIDELLPPTDSVEAPIEHIDEELKYSTYEVLKAAPKELMYSVAKEHDYHYDPTSAPGYDENNHEDFICKVRIISDSNGSGKIVLPADFIRFIRLNMTDWHRPVDNLISVDSNKYKLQKNESLRGGKYKPVGALIPFSDYTNCESYYPGGEPVDNVNQAIEYFTSDNHSIDSFMYVPEIDPVDLSQELLEPMIEICASKALRILRRYEEAKVAYESAYQSLKITGQ